MIVSRRWLEAGLALLVLAAGMLVSDRTSRRSTSEEAWLPERFLMAPVRIHLLRASGSPAGTHLRRDDAVRILRKANTIWAPAGIALWLESVVEEKPAAAVPAEEREALEGDALLPLRPRASRAPGVLHVYMVGRMTVNGLYVGPGAIFVQEAAQLYPVTGGLDEPLPRVMAHELGHAFGLFHRQARTNLMASGTTGVLLNATERETARETATKLEGVEAAPAYLAHAEALAQTGAIAEARARFEAIAALPGDSPLKARAREALGAVPPLP